MLSFLYRLIRGFQREHGFSPNTLYLNQFHYRALRQNLSQLKHEETKRFLRLRIVLLAEARHPHLAWLEEPRRRCAGA